MTDQELEQETNNLNAKPDLLIFDEKKENFFSITEYQKMKNAFLPRYTVNVPANPGTEGEIIWVKTGGLYYLYAYLNGGWRRVQVS